MASAVLPCLQKYLELGCGLARSASELVIGKQPAPFLNARRIMSMIVVSPIMPVRAMCVLLVGLVIIVIVIMSVPKLHGPPTIASLLRVIPHAREVVVGSPSSRSVAVEAVEVAEVEAAVAVASHPPSKGIQVAKAVEVASHPTRKRMQVARELEEASRMLAPSRSATNVTDLLRTMFLGNGARRRISVLCVESSWVMSRPIPTSASALAKGRLLLQWTSRRLPRLKQRPRVLLVRIG